MLPFDEALSRVVEAATFLGPKPVPLDEAVGRILAEIVTADLDLPPFDTTAMDGWAVYAADVPSVPTVLEIAGVIGAGRVPDEPLRRGTTLKVMTGAPMPEESDAVVPVEASELLDDGRVRLDESPKPGAHIRRRGEVVAKGATLLSPGRRLTAADLVLAAGAGRETLSVARRARAGILVTGNEVVPPASAPGPGQIRNTNGPLLHAACQRIGMKTRDLGIVRDDRGALRRALASALDAELDFLLTTGGVSAGDYDLVGDVLRELGADIRFHKVAIRPAKPLLFAVKGRTLVFALPGNPVSAAVAFDFFVRPAWRKASGLTPPLPEAVEARLSQAIRNRGPRVAIHPALLSFEETSLVATPLDTKGSHDVAAHARANGFVLLASGSNFEAGDRVPAYAATEEMTIG